jgi:pimeloyl-ACP methyl ester carboxylesterase
MPDTTDEESRSRTVRQRALAAARCRELRIGAPDGLSVSAQEWGDSGGVDCVFIHGFLQSHLCWWNQFSNRSLTRALHMVTYDIRGHGGSDKIGNQDLYRESGRFADELHAVISAFAMHNPILVGWSYGTRIIADYLTKYGDRAIAGINFIGSSLSDDEDHGGPGLVFLERALSDDFAWRLNATREFNRACFCRPPPTPDLDQLVAISMTVPSKVRQWMRRPGSYDAVLKSVRIPVLITHGTADAIKLPGAARYVARAVRRSELSLYAETGHSPFWEDPVRFNRELARFVRRAHANRA